VFKKRLLWTAVALVLTATGQASAEDPIKIGAIYPLTGATASAGTALRDAVEVAAGIINNPRPELSALAYAPGGGLPGLGGRKVEPVFADNQGNPATSQNQALRLITQEKVVAMVGTYTSSTTLTASAVAERYGIPFVAGEASAPSLTLRGFKWFFRPTPIGTDFGAAYASFLVGLAAKGHPVKTVALVNENTEYGTSTGEAISKAIEAKGLKISPHIAYSANSTDVSAEVLQLKQANPDAVIFVSYTSDSILFMKTMRNLDWKPPVLIGDDSGFSDTAFIAAVGDLAEGAVNRSSYDIGKPGTVPYALNEIYKKKTGHNLDDTSARGLEGFLVMCDAINRAGSTEPAKIQAALKATDMPPSKLMIGYDGVKFDANGQNEKAATLLVQLRNKEYVAIWPDKSATTQVILPFKGWGP
jgi:branched-chain amino acid transport system substrate-binding protein